jgi:23S rRNA (uracil1939-C5)-methyltransferase/tRNA (uracil-5-)-methyltransferase
VRNGIFRRQVGPANFTATIVRLPKKFVPEPFAYHEEVELEINDLTNLGEGVGRIDDWVVMVPFALPGERVKARIWRNKTNYSDADLVEVLKASPDRVEPPCALFQECGGCQYQHLSYEAQWRWKTAQIVELMRRLAGLEIEVQPCRGSTEAYGYRSKLTPHYQRPKDGKMGPIGFLRYSSRSIIDVEQCPIARPLINERLTEERALMHAMPPKKGKGGTLLLREGDDGVTTDNKDLRTGSVGDKRFQFIAGEFFQNNPYVLPLLVEYALDESEKGGERYFVDAYCGVGVFGICGAERFEAVAGIEVSPPAVALAQANAALNGVKNADFLIGSAEAIFEELKFPAAETCVLMDPPRRGSDELFLSQLVAYGPKRVVYVSCGPDTQARDLRYLIDRGYRVERIQPFDLFPQTRHIENVVTLVKEPA